MNTATAVSQFVLDEFLADDGVDQLDEDFDLVATGVIDSLGLLELLSWIQDEFDIVVEEADLWPNDLRSVQAISRFIDAARAGARYSEGGT